MITAPQLNSNENGLFDGGKFLVTSQVNTPKNHKKNIVERIGPRVPKNGNQSSGRGMGENDDNTMKAATTTPISASPAIKPAESRVPLLTSSLPDLIAFSDGWPARVPSTRKCAVLVTKWLSTPPKKMVAER